MKPIFKTATLTLKPRFTLSNFWKQVGRPLRALSLLAFLGTVANPASAALISNPDEFVVINSSARVLFDFDEGASTNTRLVWNLTQTQFGTVSAGFRLDTSSQFLVGSEAITNLNNTSVNYVLPFSTAMLFGLSLTPGGSATFAISLITPVTSLNPFLGTWNVAAGAGGTSRSFTINDVPAPGAALLLGFGLIGFVAAKQRNAA